MLTDMQIIASDFCIHLNDKLDVINHKFNDYFELISNRLPQGYFELKNYTVTSGGCGVFNVTLEIKMCFSDETDIKDIVKIICESLKEYNDSEKSFLRFENLQKLKDETYHLFIKTFI